MTLSRPIILMATLTITLFSITLLFYTTASADAFIVTNTNDDGPGSLRQVISDTLTSPGPDQITFDPSLDGQTITLTTGQLVISGEIEIDGSDLPNGITISGDDQFRVLFIELGAIVTLDRLTLTNGATETGFGACLTLCGGGIFADTDSTVTIIDSKILNSFGNSAGGIINSGNMTISGSLIRGNRAAYDGGGIRNSGKMTISQSSIVSNTTEFAYGGAGIYEETGTLLIDNSTIAYNRAQGSGGGIRSYGSLSIIINQSTMAHNSATNLGGGVFIESTSGATGTTAVLSIINSTISSNEADQGGGLYGSANLTTTLALTLTHTTVNENTGGGISIVPSSGGNDNSSVYNSIIANSTGDNCTGLGGDQSSLSDDGSCEAFSQGNPQLGPLADNGGNTQTHALLANSAAFSLGNTAVCQAHGSDQRGLARSEVACDAGSVEIVDSYLLFLPIVIR